MSGKYKITCRARFCAFSFSLKYVCVGTLVWLSFHRQVIQKWYSYRKKRHMIKPNYRKRRIVFNIMLTVVFRYKWAKHLEFTLLTTKYIGKKFFTFLNKSYLLSQWFNSDNQKVITFLFVFSVVFFFELEIKHYLRKYE